MVETDANGPPPFEDAFAGDDVEQRIYGTILQTREPTTASAIADTADCDPKTARKYLNWFDNLGIVTRHDGHPATYERNDAYFEWRRINQLAAAHSVEELQNRVRELTTRITEYEDTYDAASPAAVDAIAVVEASDDQTIDDVYSDLADWATTREERERYERARQQRMGSEREQASG
ncbi:sugar-specific transcriptional regulator TrmB [Haladaptatus sp. YSMS36]|uniref:DUF7342 family protein n=1 Tax=Haladaptatus sp. YSMS36 TaxID=3033384 RepID=UPI0023E79FD3|nr:sugar-specific transcriptional regulator TrmB [Haladaptatus sp. YSMS36]